MIPQRYSAFAFSFFMALLMSCIMSLVITLFNLGFIEGLWLIWLKSWAFAFSVALPAILLVSPLVRRLVLLVVSSETH